MRCGDFICIHSYDPNQIPGYCGIAVEFVSRGQCNYSGIGGVFKLFKNILGDLFNAPALATCLLEILTSFMRDAFLVYFKIYNFFLIGDGLTFPYE
ncbi:unnamed protein product [Strongylus vulgaris]|uniref:Uncharacterized protein n=1 Tax=Strongylus vulgaris TaxID=40348 RepID=A0A3P7JB72_STRVU|nr:unnamed protein product [Strongylus vulgaris]